MEDNASYTEAKYFPDAPDHDRLGEEQRGVLDGVRRVLSDRRPHAVPPKATHARLTWNAEEPTLWLSVTRPGTRHEGFVIRVDSQEIAFYFPHDVWVVRHDDRLGYEPWHALAADVVDGLLAGATEAELHYRGDTKVGSRTFVRRADGALISVAEGGVVVTWALLNPFLPRRTVRVPVSIP